MEIRAKNIRLRCTAPPPAAAAAAAAAPRLMRDVKKRRCVQREKRLTPTVHSAMRLPTNICWEMRSRTHANICRASRKMN